MPLVSDRSDDREDALDDRKAVNHWTGFQPLEGRVFERPVDTRGPPMRGNYLCAGRAYKDDHTFPNRFSSVSIERRGRIWFAGRARL